MASAYNPDRLPKKKARLRGLFPDEIKLKLRVTFHHHRLDERGYGVSAITL